MTRRPQQSIFLLIILLLAACAPAGAEPAASERPFVLPTPPTETQPATIELIATTDVIFLGEVSFISETKRDANGDAYHQVALSVLETGIDALGIGSGVVLTAPGESPLHGRYALAVGDKVVVMARQAPAGPGSPALVVIPADGRLFISADQWDSVLATLMRAEMTN